MPSVPTATATTRSLLGLTDCELVAEVRRGCDRAFEQLYERYHRRIAAYIYGMVDDYGRAEDIVQDVFLSALRRIRDTDRAIAFKPWVYEIAKNACIDQFRRARRAQEVSYDAGDGLGAPGPVGRRAGAIIPTTAAEPPVVAPVASLGPAVAPPRPPDAVPPVEPVTAASGAAQDRVAEPVRRAGALAEEGGAPVVAGGAATTDQLDAAAAAAGAATSTAAGAVTGG